MNKSKKVILADDDAGILDAVGMMLELEGFDVTTTLDGNEIFSTGFTPDLYILDIWMSGSDGRDLCKKLKATPATHHIPVMLISASNDLQRSASDAGADDFLPKPFDMELLVTKINRLLA